MSFIEIIGLVLSVTAVPLVMQGGIIGFTGLIVGQVGMYICATRPNKLN